MRPTGHKRGRKPHKRRARSRAAEPPREVEAEITSLGLQGDGVAELDGSPVHVPFTLAGERARLSVQGTKGRLLHLIDAAPQRVVPACPHFGREGDECGGCALQHLAFDAYLEWKRGHVATALARAGFEPVLAERATHEAQPVVLPVEVSPPASRRRAGFAIEFSEGRLVAGFHQRHSHSLVALEECHVLHPALVACRDTLLRAVSPLFRMQRDLKVTAHVTQAQNGLDVDIASTLDDEDLTLEARETLIECLLQGPFLRFTLNGTPFYQREQPLAGFGKALVPLPPRAFLQATVHGEQALQNIIRTHAKSARTIVDLFSGCGTFSFPAAEAGKVRTYEGDRHAVAAMEQAHADGVHVLAHQRDLFRQPLMPSELRDTDLVIIDPPRAGADEQARQLAQSDVPRIVSISCNPRTFARDARILADGGYQLKSIRPVDQFLFSSHIEVAGIFERPGA